MLILILAIVTMKSNAYPHPHSKKTEPETSHCEPMTDAIGLQLCRDPTVQESLVAEFISPPKVYTFSFIVGNIIPRSVECIRSATK